MTAPESGAAPPSDDGPAGPSTPETPLPTLPFDSAEIEELVLRFNAVMVKEATDVPDLGGNAADDEIAVTMQETRGDLSRDEITQEIESMNDEQKDGLVALFWIGRGDAEPAEWEATKALARQQHEGLVSRYLLGQPEVGEYLTEGLEKMLEFGVA